MLLGVNGTISGVMVPVGCPPARRIRGSNSLRQRTATQVPSVLNSTGPMLAGSPLTVRASRPRHGAGAPSPSGPPLGLPQIGRFGVRPPGLVMIEIDQHGRRPNPAWKTVDP